MIPIVFPEPDFRIIREGRKDLIFDPYRKRFVTLTPEEWVRQNFLGYLVKTMAYPAALIGIEKEIRLGTLKKRYDIIVYNRAMQPWMIVECKEMNVPLTQLTLEQVNRYHMVLPSAYLVITNGQHTFCCSCVNAQQQWQFLQQLPAYQ
ncbi:type I restriction enzyme HsdR N-terminal domain-containing protein [Chitinophaga pendula]|uniref:type I restriction enzyme HsdR N-terminal domain-containing protein n=1 Tax=Chitinophaga TaxID=79328 RepID=UPI000BAF8ED5|nr:MULTISPECIES: type I restriction enzyme HsdR N-terminal domain-containing protein [Chitinophaga]ASZ11160.1 restriction endonuclease subunit R [Chitinophaga sp. MD30]UCJ05844.1 type I restriction enzyme HsdR N-terminal domain-containing protein [Chitinophaga pendula]